MIFRRLRQSTLTVLVQPMADHGLLFTFGDRIDAALSRRIGALTDALTAESLPGIIDLVPSYTTLMVLIEPGVADPAEIGSRVNHHWRQVATQVYTRQPQREVVIPVEYGHHAGPDLLDVARITGLPPDEVIRRHAAARYQVGAIGFSPGFAFLIGLPPELATPRRSSPRTAVPAGSVGIGGAQTGIYAQSTPGGWSLIGRTALTMFDPERDPPSLLQAGDAVRFEPTAVGVVSPGCEGLPQGRPVLNQEMVRHLDAVEVLAPGLQTSVQDLGRTGYGRLGVSPGGAIDRASLIAGNRLLGNLDDAAALEITMVGPHLRFLRPGRIVVTGADLGAQLNGLPLPVGAVRVVGPDDEIAFHHGRGRGLRSYLCLAGGIDVPVRLGSRATDLTAGFGGFEGRALISGDRLRVGGERRASHDPGLPMRTTSGTTFRVARGPQVDRFDEATWNTFISREFTVSSKSNRLGIRLEGPAIVPVGGADIISEGMVTGAIQITGEGQPIVMLPARATIGGYPKIATVISADLDRLGQLRPGDRIKFEEAGLLDGTG